MNGEIIKLEATNRYNTLLQQIALCVQSSDKSYALIAAIGCTDKSSLILCDILQRQNSVAVTKFSIKFSCSYDKICYCKVLQRFAASCPSAAHCNKGIPRHLQLTKANILSKTCLKVIDDAIVKKYDSTDECEGLNVVLEWQMLSINVMSGAGKRL